MDSSRPPSHIIKKVDTPPPSNLSVFVSGLPASWGSNRIITALAENFEKFGEVYSVDLSDSMSYGFVRFFNGSAVNKALHADHPIIVSQGCNANVKIREADQPSISALHIGGFTKDERELSREQLEDQIKHWSGEDFLRIEVPVTEEGTNKGYCLVYYKNLQVATRAFESVQRFGKKVSWVKEREADAKKVLSTMKKSYYDIIESLGEDVCF